MNSEQKALSKPEFSSGLSPGQLPGVDGRTWSARRYRELVSTMAEDIGGDLTTAKQAIVCRAASLMTWCELQEADHANGGKLDIGAYTTAVNTMRRLLADLGLERIAKDVPELKDWIKGREAGK